MGGMMGGMGGGGMGGAGGYWGMIAKAASSMFHGLGKMVTPEPYTMGQPQMSGGNQAPGKPFQPPAMSGIDVMRATGASSPAAGGVPAGVSVAGPNQALSQGEANIMFPKGVPQQSATAATGLAPPPGQQQGGIQGLAQLIMQRMGGMFGS